jgi:hypothetical protein
MLTLPVVKGKSKYCRMKATAIALLLPLLAEGTAVNLREKSDRASCKNWLTLFPEPRQVDALGGLSSTLGSTVKGWMNRAAPKQKAFKIEQLTPKNAGAKRIRMTWGPMKVKGANVSARIARR